ncbi:MAG TPA: hypothetical protein VN047_09185 [Sphingopyxis sp.]|nr:hypothetical protein [Sphingopyxis sp.]
MVLLAGGAALLLAGCSSNAGSDSDDTAAAQKTSLGVQGEPLRAGLYHVTQTGDVDIREERCLKASDVEAGRFAVTDMTGDGWTINTNRMSGGMIEIAARHPSGGRLDIEGTFEKESFELEGTLELKVNGEAHVVRTKQRGEFASPTCPEGMG